MVLPIVEKVCLICEKPFQTRIPRKKYCDNCQLVGIRINQVVRRGKSFEEAKRSWQQKVLLLNSKKCLDCKKFGVDARNMLRCTECTRVKRTKSDRWIERKHNMRFKCVKCGEPTTRNLKCYRSPKLCEKHKKIKERLRRLLLFWHKQDLKKRSALQ